MATEASIQAATLCVFWEVTQERAMIILDRFPEELGPRLSHRSHRSHRFQRRFGEVTGPSYPDVLPEVRFTAGINMTCVEPDGQVKPAWGVLGAADHGGTS